MRRNESRAAPARSRRKAYAGRTGAAPKLYAASPAAARITTVPGEERNRARIEGREKAETTESPERKASAREMRDEEAQSRVEEMKGAAAVNPAAKGRT
jgi:hypothetical protein